MKYRAPPKGIPHPKEKKSIPSVIFFCVTAGILAFLLFAGLVYLSRWDKIPETTEEMWNDLYRNYHYVEDSGTTIRYTKTICGVMTDDYYTVWPENRFPFMKEEERIEKSPGRISKAQYRKLEKEFQEHPEILSRKPFVNARTANGGFLESTREATVIYSVYGQAYPIRTISAVYMKRGGETFTANEYIDLLTNDIPPEEVLREIRDREPEYVRKKD